MENLPTEKQTVAPRLNFFLFLPLGLVILILIGEGVYYLKLKKNQVASQLSVEPQPEVFLSKIASPHPTGTFESPVRKENMEKGKIIQVDYNVNDWAIFLPEGDPVYAGFSGLVEWAGEGSPQKVILLKSEDGKLIWKHLLVGEPLIKNGQRVEKGEMIAKLGLEPLPTYDVNLIIQASLEGRRVNLDLH